MNLEEYTTTELETEIDRRKKAAPPDMWIENDNALRKLLRDYVDYVASEDYHEDNDFKHYIYECVLETYYSKDFWEWKRAVTK